MRLSTALATGCAARRSRRTRPAPSSSSNSPRTVASYQASYSAAWGSRRPACRPSRAGGPSRRGPRCRAGRAFSRKGRTTFTCADRTSRCMRYMSSTASFDVRSISSVMRAARYGRLPARAERERERVRRHLVVGRRDVAARRVERPRPLALVDVAAPLVLRRSSPGPAACRRPPRGPETPRAEVADVAVHVRVHEVEQRRVHPAQRLGELRPRPGHVQPHEALGRARPRRRAPSSAAPAWTADARARRTRSGRAA